MDIYFEGVCLTLRGTPTKLSTMSGALPVSAQISTFKPLKFKIAQQLPNLRWKCIIPLGAANFSSSRFNKICEISLISGSKQMLNTSPASNLQNYDSSGCLPTSAHRDKNRIFYSTSIHLFTVLSFFSFLSLL